MGVATPEAESKSYLDKMPSEILNEIFKHCREPSLIHTSSRLHRELPSYMYWTQRLAGMALIATPTPDDGLAWCHADEFQEDPTITIANRDFALPGLQAPLPEDERDQLQKEVVQSKWFTLKHFELTYASIFRMLLHTFFLECNRFQHSPGQIKRVQKFYSAMNGFDGFEELDDLNLRLRSHFGTLKMEITGNGIKLFHRRRMLLNDCSVMRLRYVPNCALGVEPSSLIRNSALDLIFLASPESTIQDRRYFSYNMRLECCRDSLKTAMRTSIGRCCTGPGPIMDINEYCYFSTLHELDRTAVLASERSLVDLDMLKAATRSYDPSCLQDMLEPIRYRKREEIGVSKEDLVEMVKGIPNDDGYAGIIETLVDTIRVRDEMEERRRQHEHWREMRDKFRGGSEEEQERFRAGWYQRYADRSGRAITDPQGTVYHPATQACGSGGVIPADLYRQFQGHI